MYIEHNEEYDQYYAFVDRSEALKHHGVKDQKWGIRRWQNEDGSLTPEGRAHYGIGQARGIKGAIQNVKGTIRRNKDEIKELGVMGWLNDDRSPNKVKQQQINKANSKSNNMNSLKEMDDEITNFIDSSGKIIESKVIAFAKANPEKVREMYFKDKENGVIDNLDSNTQKVLKDRFENNVNNHPGVQEAKSEINNLANDVKNSFQNGVNSINKQNGTYSKERFKFDVYDEDLGEWAHGRDALKSYGLKKKDLAMDHDGYIVRKDGKQFEVTLANGKKKSYDYLDEVSDAMDYGAVPVGKNSEKRERIRAKNQRRAEQLKKSGYTVEEIAQKLGVPKGTVTSYLYQG